MPLRLVCSIAHLGAPLVLLAACGPGAEPGATKVEAQQPAAPAQAAGPATPYAAAEQKMHQAMAAASGATLDETWTRKMIPHHQGAVDMSRVALGSTQDADIRRMAQKTVDMQTMDIADLQRWLEQHAPPTGAGPAGDPFRAAEDRMNQAMMAASGEGEVLWARKMIPHHQGAADLSRIVLEQSDDPAIREKARKIIDESMKDIRELEAWLSEHGG